MQQHDFSSSAPVGKKGTVIFFPEDSAPTITLCHLNKKAPAWQRTQIIRKHLPIEARREYNRKRAAWIASRDERQEQEITQETERRTNAVASMKKSLGSWKNPKRSLG